MKEHSEPLKEMEIDGAFALEISHHNRYLRCHPHLNQSDQASKPCPQAVKILHDFASHCNMYHSVTGGPRCGDGKVFTSPVLPDRDTRKLSLSQIYIYIYIYKHRYVCMFSNQFFICLGANKD